MCAVVIAWKNRQHEQLTQHIKVQQASAYGFRIGACGVFSAVIKCDLLLFEAALRETYKLN